MIGLAPNLARAARLRFEPITATVTGLRISAVDGTAFIDNLPANILARCDGNHQITIRDADNRELVGVLKAQGVSETVGSEWITSIVNLETSPYETFVANVNNKDIDSAINTSGLGMIRTNNIDANPPTITGQLMKIATDFTLVSGTAPRLLTKRETNSSNVLISEELPTGESGYYRTWDENRLHALGSRLDTGLALQNVETTGDWALVWSCKTVTAPSATGATIVSTKAGTTYNFASLNASFVYNAASYSVTVQRI